MKRTLAILASSAALLASTLTLAGSAAQAASATNTTSYTTVMTQTRPVPSAGVLPGRLQLKIADDGTVSGWYMPEYSGDFVPVYGGRHGDQLWLTIGNQGSVRVDATLQKDGRIVGTATDYSMSEFPYTGIPIAFDFVAKPTPNGQASY